MTLLPVEDTHVLCLIQMHLVGKVYLGPCNVLPCVQISLMQDAQGIACRYHSAFLGFVPSQIRPLLVAGIRLGSLILPGELLAKGYFVAPSKEDKYTSKVDGKVFHVPLQQWTCVLSYSVGLVF